MVVLGNSMAYGPSDPRMAWPRLLSLEMGRSVYNMALPGYGPGQNLMQLDEALALAPSLVIVSPYFGYDFFGSYALALRHPELTSAMPSALRVAASARQRQRPLATDLQSSVEPGAVALSAHSGWRRYLSDHVKLYGLLRAVRYGFAEPPPTPALSGRYAEAVAGLTPALRRLALPVEAGAWRTILTPAYRDHLLDDQDPRIRLGFEIALRAVRVMSERCRAAGVALLVVLIPTKESVFWPRVKTSDRDPDLASLIAHEQRLRTEWHDDLAAAGVRYVDVLDVLREAKAQPYYENIDGHPNELGHQLIAAAVAARLGNATRHE